MWLVLLHVCTSLQAQPRADGAIQLGETGYIDFGDPGGDAFDLVLGEERSFAFWMFYPKRANHVKLLDKRLKFPPNNNATDAGGYTTFIHQFTGTAGIFVDSRGYGRNAGGASGLRIIADGDWHHVAYVLADSVLQIVVDGELDETHVIQSHPEFLPTDYPLWYGWNSTGDVHNTGGVDELSVWRRALSASEIRQLMYTRPAPNAVGLTAYYPMDALPQDGQVTDIGPNGYHGQAYEASIIPALRPKAPPWTSRWWFKALLAMMALGGVYALMRAYAWRIEQKHRALEEIVDDRTSALSEALGTVEAQAETLREMDEAKNRFVASISHEFRTPLTLALGLANDLIDGRQGPLSEAQRHDLMHIGENNRQLLRLVNQLLEVARLEAGAMRIQVRAVDIAQQLARLAEAFVPLAERKQVRFERTLPPVLQAWADPDQVELIATNLLSNAFKFTLPGGEVRLALYQEDVHAVLDVQDTGEGIAAAHLPHIFDRFYQADDSHKHVGTGIGLATLKEVVDLHGGHVEVASTPGSGSRFTIRLPIERRHFEALAHADVVDQPVPAVEERAEARPLAPPVEVGTTGTTKAAEADQTTVLIVDDHADIRGFVRRHLSTHYRMLEAEDGNAALETIRAHLPDVVISDVMMPQLDGFGLVQAIRADPAISFIPVILLTARAAAQDRLEGLEHGADDYLTKPFAVDELRLRVRNTIQHQQRLRRHLQQDAASHALLADAHAGKTPSPDSEPSAAEQAFIAHVEAAIKAHLSDETFNVEALADALAMDRSHLYRRVQAAMGASPSAVLRIRRLERAEQLLQAGAGSVSEVAYAVGFNSASYFSKRFREHFGTSPSQVSAAKPA
ncbi:MAG: hypothetical protein RhofKO_35060 [Rhodothermales bacterium]